MIYVFEGGFHFQSNHYRTALELADSKVWTKANLIPLYILISFMETVFLDDEVQMCSLASCFRTADCVWPNTANVWLSER